MKLLTVFARKLRNPASSGTSRDNAPSLAVELVCGAVASTAALALSRTGSCWPASAASEKSSLSPPFCVTISQFQVSEGLSDWCNLDHICPFLICKGWGNEYLPFSNAGHEFCFSFSPAQEISPQLEWGSGTRISQKWQMSANLYLIIPCLFQLTEDMFSSHPIHLLSPVAGKSIVLCLYLENTYTLFIQASPFSRKFPWTAQVILGILLNVCRFSCCPSVIDF